MSHRILRLLYLFVPLGLIALFVLRPTPIVGVDGESLAASTGSTVNEINSVPCKQEGGEDDDKWMCTYPGVPDPEPGDPGPTTYEVTIDGWGCWNIGGVQGPTDPPETSGCVTLMNHISSID
jgi:hypothetical protein